MSEQLFSTDMPDLESFIKELDMFNDNVNTALRKGMHEAGNMINSAAIEAWFTTAVPA